MPPSDRTKKRKQLFVVFPTRLLTNDGAFFVGNHFTFMVNPKSPEDERLQFHLTRYRAFADSVHMETSHTKNNLPLRFPLSADRTAFSDERLHDPDLQREAYAAPLHSLFREGTAGAQQEGGAGNKNRAGRPKATRAVQRRGARAPAFDDLWYELPLHAMTIVGVPTADGYDVSVTACITEAETSMS